ncbi:cation diffusion facilitator family transporter [Actinokineospora iranica]|uniref:Cation diffusion facilitator family transporter n=2 Tax=Actinokineospora iranica TaxID=1271860 RepID=A0A1G6THN6_9PSEU|nr:cation diffusion facilitator family transporter [Actinokineospora iranica]
MRALWISFGVLLVTAAAQAVIVALSGSVALLGDTLHNVADALTAVPLAIAFALGRRAATRRFTYGLGRAEDLAGLVVVVLIALSACAAGYQAVSRIIEPRAVEHLALVAVAGAIGFLGNELVARYRIRVGREIGSGALVADGLHARTDGLTSLVVVLAAGGTWAGIPYADPVVGLGMTVLIVLVLRAAAREVFGRLLDGVDPELVDRAELTLADTPGVRGVTAVRLRWVGHRLFAESTIVADADSTLLAAHTVAVEAEHRLRHSLRHLAEVTIHIDPAPHPDPDHPAHDHHAALAHHLR